MNSYSQILDDVAEKDKAIVSGKRIDIPEQLLWGLYWGNCYDIWKIAKIFGCGEMTIYRRLKDYCIPIYSGYRGDVNFSNVQQQIFEGCMLGDGGMRKEEEKKYPRFYYTDKNREYLKFISELLDIGYISEIYSCADAFQLWTRQLIGFNDKYHRWYPDGKGTIDDRHYKVIPHDLELIPVSMLFWYLGDGYYHKNDGILYFKNSLNREDGEFLKDEIKRVLNVEEGVTLNRAYDIYNIRLNKKATNRFFELIKETGFDIPKCYQYKFEMEV